MLSVFNGFEGLVKSLYSSFYPQLKISPVSGKHITLTQQQLNEIRSVKGIKDYSLVAEEKALLQNGPYQSIVYLKGVDDNYSKVTGVPTHIIKGDFNVGNADAPLLILGAGIENAVGVQTDRNLAPLVIYLPKKNDVNLLNPLQSISADTINTSGTFIIQQDFDNKYAITNLAFVKRMLDMPPDEYGAAEIALIPDADEEDVKIELQKILGNTYSVQTRYQQNQSLYAVMGAEKWAIYAILTLLLLVASFTMASALTMLVLEKKNDIAVLHALGGNRAFIQKIFLTEGLLLAIIGGLIGMLLAVLLAVLQTNFKLIPLQGGSFLIDYFPVVLNAADFLLVGGTIFIIAMLASWIPARQAAAQHLSLRSE